MDVKEVLVTEFTIIYFAIIVLFFTLNVHSLGALHVDIMRLVPGPKHRGLHVSYLACLLDPYTKA
jgi:hypothetical protein